MQAATVRGVGELFGSEAQHERIERLEAEVRELRAIVDAMGARGLPPRGPDPNVVYVDLKSVRDENEARREEVYVPRGQVVRASRR